jgi:hypothetical protein
VKRRSVPFALAIFACAVAAGAQGQVPVRPTSEDFVAPGPVVPLAAPVMSAMAGIRQASLAAHVGFLASPALEGRGLGARGLDGAAEYVAASLALAGVAPVPQAGGGVASAPYFHPVALREIRHRSGRVEVECRRGDAADSWTFVAGADVVLPELPPGTFSAPVVFAGYGIREDNPPRDDYRDIDVKGRIVVVEDGLPPGGEWKQPDLVKRYASADTDERHAGKRAIAAALGARAVIAIEREGFASAVEAAAASPAPPFFLDFDDPVSDGLPPVIRVSARVGDAMLAGDSPAAGPPEPGQPRALAGVTASVTASGDERTIISRNVMGMIRGSDPRLRAEAVVVGAHMDHLGRSGDRTYPGADDNASGVAALLEISRAFAASGRAPKRTLIFVFWTGEEEGHLGSEHYVRHPAWPLDRTSVYLNLDMIGHPWKAEEIRTLVADTRLDSGAAFLAAVRPADFVELGVAESAPQLGAVLAQAARASGLALHLDRTDGRHGGSDYRAFARKGLPFVRFFGNYFDGYHQPVDTADRLDAGQVLKMARLAFASAWLMADR